MADQMNIYQKMLAIESELTTVAKNLFVDLGRSSYKAVGEADVLAAVKPLEAKYGVYSYPCGRTICYTDIMTKSATDSKGNVRETQSLVLRIETKYRFVNVEKPDEYIEVTTYGDGVDTQDKAPGKAMTYADKYAILKAYKIITGDDPDQAGSDTGKFRSADTGSQVPPSCADCGVVITAAEERYSMRKYGAPLCRSCQGIRSI